MTSCPCGCHDGTGFNFGGCPSCFQNHNNDNTFQYPPQVQVYPNVNEMKLDRIIELLEKILEELKK